MTMSDNDNQNPIPLVELEHLPIQLTIFEPDPIVRPEYNIGKFAGIIFASPYAKNLAQPRIHEWRIQRGADEAIASLTITPQYGQQTPTTTTLRVYLALLQLWSKNGQPADGVVDFSSRQLAAVIGWKWAGSATAKRIASHITILKSTGLTWIWSYKQPTGETNRKVSDISILSSAEYNERKTLLKGERFTSVQRIRFNPDLVDNMLKGHVRPMNYNALRAIPNDTSLNLYARIDIYLSKKTRWERRSLELFRDELKLEGQRWEQRRLRYAKLKEFVKQLDGVELCHGRLKVWIERTKDDEDYKFIAIKVPRTAPKQRTVLTPVTGKEEAESLAEELLETIRRLPQGGNPRPQYFYYLCRMYPASLIYRALATAKADYQGKVEKSVTHIFVYELRRLVREAKGLTWHGDLKREGEGAPSSAPS